MAEDNRSASRASRRRHRGKRAKPLVIRLHSKILRDQNSGCWLWQGSVCRAGYGKIAEGYRGGRTLKTHRAAWEIHRGPIPDGMNVLHRCDTPNCVNPAHLWLGSHMDNVQDKLRKRRGRNGTVRGEQNLNSKITREQARAIRVDPRYQRQIAADYGISRSNVSSIKRGVTWNW